MRYARGAALPALTTLALSCGASPVLALSGVSGGTQAPSSSQTAGSAHGVPAHAVQAQRPVVSELNVPRAATAGHPPRVTLRIDETGVGTVYSQVAITDLSTRSSAVVAAMGWAHTGRTLTVTWPANAKLSPGSYQVSVSAHDHHGATLLRGAHSSGEASLTVNAAVKPTATSPPPSIPPSTISPEAGVPTPAQSAAAGAVFPVAGAHNFGGPENLFGAPRNGYLHQGQDVLTAEGTPVVAPMAGTILTTSYQAGGAGYYAVEHTGVGFDFMFAHCQAASLAVSTGQAVSAGQALCKAGQTGDATTPHLDFEMWVGGWQASTGHPIDPLAYLEAWEREAAG
jgi:murein DD-endopeptidase MepM/ murein hydrolase activator NlpD